MARLLENARLLLVLDNLESLLTPVGTWRDPRWQPLIAALTEHQGESRVVLTSRVPPSHLPASVLVMPVHVLDLAESVALARELPGLRRLLEPGSGQVAGDEAAGRHLVRRVLRVVQGHPKLMEFADAAAAAGAAQLAAQLRAAEQAAEGQVLGAFFRDGATALDAGRFLDALTSWTTIALDALPGPVRLMARFLTSLEDTDRTTAIIRANWAGLWHRLEGPGQPPGPGPVLNTLAAAALIQPGPVRPRAGEPGEVASWRMHPAVAGAIAAGADPAIQAATDTELATFWSGVSAAALQREDGESGQFVVQAGLSAAPYLLRQHGWEAASTLLEHAVRRDRSPAVIAAAVPALRAIVAATNAPNDLRVLGRALLETDPAQAEPLLRQALDQAVASGELRVSAAAATGLVTLLRDAGRLDEALELALQQASYSRQAGFGPWTQLADQGQRLQILARAGQHREVLAETATLLEQMNNLPADPGPDEIVEPWNVREFVLDAAYESAVELGEWQEALDLNAAIEARKRDRRAGAHEIACTQFANYYPLIRLGRLADAAQLLAGCQKIFEDHDDIPLLGVVIGARAELEAERGNLSAAVTFGKTALRYGYTVPDPHNLAINHDNLASYLAQSESDPAAQRAHRLAAALLRQLTGMTRDLTDSLEELASELDQDTACGPLPRTPAEVVAITEQTEGVQLGRLLIDLQPDARVVATALTDILNTAASGDLA